MADLLTVEVVNGLDEDAFVATFGEVLEDSPHLAAETWARRPFADRHALVAAFGHALDSLGDAEQLTLLCAHPELGARRPMAAASVAEQQGVGLDTATGDLVDRIRATNQRYRARFGFPFIVAVSGRSLAEIADVQSERLDNAPAIERARALDEVRRIAAIRIEQLVAST